MKAIFVIIALCTLIVTAFSAFTIGEPGISSLTIGGVMKVVSYYNLEAGDEEAAMGFKLDDVRLVISGDISPDFGFLVHPYFEDNALTLIDCWVDWHPVELFSLKAGQQKAPIGRCYEVSGSKLMFQEKTPLCCMVPRYEVGIAPTLHFMEDKIGVSCGVFNGEGLSIPPTSGNQDDGLLFSARIDFAPYGTYGADESAHTGFDELKFIVTPGFYMNETEDSTAELATTVYGGHLSLRYDYLAFDASLYTGTIEDDLTDSQTKPMGFSVQTGYAIAGKYEPIIRFSMIDPDTDGDEDETTTIEAGFNYYIKGYNSRIAVNYKNATEKIGNDEDLTGEVTLYYELTY